MDDEDPFHLVQAFLFLGLKCFVFASYIQAAIYIKNPIGCCKPTLPCLEFFVRALNVFTL